MPKIKLKTNTIFRGDNLAIMRGLPDKCVDLIYVDPPFYTKKTYIDNFWGDKESIQSLEDVKKYGFSDTKDFFEKHIKSNAKGLSAYLEWMRLRIQEMHRILKDDGCFYLHLDYHAIHYIKVICDEIFGLNNHLNEIIWLRSSNSSSISKIYRRAHDTILFYAKSKNYYFDIQRTELSETSKKLYSKKDAKGYYQLVPLLVSGKRNGETGKTWRGIDPNKRGKSGMHWVTKPSNLDEYDKKGLVVFSKNGVPRLKYYLEDNEGVPCDDVWTDINPIGPSSIENRGWPTQKPVRLLERIIKASSKEGDLVFDCFAGCGTSMHAAHNLKRKWVGIDISPTAIKVNKKRLEEIGAKVEVVDEPELKKLYGIDARLKAA
jgi:DNA modification methylase